MKHIAYLSHNGEMTSFRFMDTLIRFRTSPSLERYTKVLTWDNGYLVVLAKYRGEPEIEEYIDLLPILRNLNFEPFSFLKPIKKVEIAYDENANSE